MPVRYLLALATMKSGPPSVDEVEYLRARYATIVCGACSFALMLAFPLVLRRRVDKLRRARARWQKVRYAIKVHFAISHHAAAHVPPPSEEPLTPLSPLAPRVGSASAAVAAATAANLLAQTKSPLGRGGFGEVYLSASRTHVLKFVPVAPGSPPSFERQIAAESPVLRDHPHIVNLEDLTQQLGVTDCEVFRMPVLTNQLKVGRALPADAVHAQVLGALKALWADGWAYVDIKPDNLRMPDPSKVVLIDLDCVRRPRSGGCRAAALRASLDGRTTEGWRAPAVVDFLLGGELAWLPAAAADAVLAAQLAWGAALVRLRLDDKVGYHPQLLEVLMALEQPTFDADTAARLLRRLRAAVAKAADTGGAGATEPSNEVSEDVSEATAAALFAKVPSWWVAGVPRVYRNAHGVATHLWLDALRLDVPQLRALAAQTAPDATERPKQPVPLGALVGSEVLALLRATARHAAELFEQKKPPPPAPPKAPTVNEFLAWAEQERRRARLRGGSSSGSSGALPLGRSRAKTMPATPPRLGESTLVVPPPLSPARSTTASNVFEALGEAPRRVVGEESFLRRESGRLLRAPPGEAAMPWRLSSRNELERELRKVAAAPLQAAVDAAVAEVGWLRAAVAEGGGGVGWLEEGE